MKDKATNTDYSCFDVKASKHQEESELLTSDEGVVDNDTSFRISQCSNNDTNARESKFTSDCDELETKPNNLSDETKIVTWS